MLNYTTQVKSTLFSGATLTADYADNRVVMDVSGMSKLSLDIDYAQGATETGNILAFKIEHSTDGTNWHSLVIDTTATVSDITARVWNITGDASLNTVLDIAYDRIRISAIESGVVTNAGTFSMVALVSGL